MSTLTAIRGPLLGTTFALGDVTRMGRAPENEIALSDPDVSRLHAEIIKRGMSYTVFDRNSANGVEINGVRTHEHLLKKNDEITVGSSSFLFNSDLAVHNARFSGNTVLYYPTQEHTIVRARRGSQLQTLSATERQNLEVLLNFADIVAVQADDLEAFSKQLAEQMMELFQSDCSMVLLRDRDDDLLRPLVVLPRDRTARVNRSHIAACVEDRAPLLIARDEISGTAKKLILKALGLQEVGDEALLVSSIAAPILVGESVRGMLVCEKYEPEFYSLRDLALLHAMARLSAGPLQAARVMQRVESERSVLTKSNRRQDEWPCPDESPMKEQIALAERVADSTSSVLITGPSGTGKEVMAKFIHARSPRASGPFVAVNCHAIPESLFESELFGYEKGAFTGANKTQLGKVESADGGTLFLDEIGDLALAMQAKLLRFLQERAFYRVGGIRGLEVDVRIVAATNIDLEQAVAEGRFREDLWYRLNVINLRLPPLRDRKSEIVPLAKLFLAQGAARLSKAASTLDATAEATLLRHTWPGNVRELENAVERALLLCQGQTLSAKDFAFLEAAGQNRPAGTSAGPPSVLASMAEVEREHIRVVLTHCGWSLTRAAEILGLHRNTLRNKITEYGLQPDTARA